MCEIPVGDLQNHKLTYTFAACLFGRAYSLPCLTRYKHFAIVLKDIIVDLEINQWAYSSVG